MSVHASYKFSLTIHSNDLAVVNCLRALSKFSQKSGNNRIPWGGTKDVDWKWDGHSVTFRFTTPEYRAGFLTKLSASCRRRYGQWLLEATTTPREI
ncbi:MAG: hypothetical protein HY846_01005 [Nitrosomonadales bacterium]|nr:hypothetical protein [Nitrosomonadales bacterium]